MKTSFFNPLRKALHLLTFGLISASKGDQVKPMRVSNFDAPHVPSFSGYLFQRPRTHGGLALKESFRTRNQRKRRKNFRRLIAAGGA